ncbi:MAG: PadR family transcriptional regulator [Candidatus Bathyarchaeota archaeon]|nr:PadR family transcriptional regulator [Candidatus Bathyarchaeota archaeon]
MNKQIASVQNMVALTISVNGEKSEARIIKKMHERVIKSFMDTIIMSELQNGPLSGYDVISYIHNRYGCLVSSGTVYSLLYSLERNELVEGIWIERKRIYKLTLKGTQTIETIHNSQEKIKSLLSTLL